MHYLIQQISKVCFSVQLRIITKCSFGSRSLDFERCCEVEYAIDITCLRAAEPRLLLTVTGPMAEKPEPSQLATTN